MNDVIKQIQYCGILPIITIEDSLDSIPIGQAIYDGGIPTVSVNVQEETGLSSITLISKAIPDMMVGASRVYSKDMVDAVIEAGAKFITCPSINPTIIEYCQQKNIPILPGVSTPSNIETALSFGLKYVEYFPASANGGLEGIKAVSAPYKGMMFMPRGGINESNAVTYLRDSRIFAVGGDWFLKKEWIANQEYEKIEESVKDAVRLMLDFELDHIAINFAKDEEALYAAEDFAEIFEYDVRKLGEDDGYFAGSYFETMKPGAMGTRGHIAISTNSVGRAKFHLELRGIEFDEDSKEYDDQGHIRNILLKKEIGGFAIQLIRRDAKKGRGEVVFSANHPRSLDAAVEINLKKLFEF